jgi:hypothetical protein
MEHWFDGLAKELAAKDGSRRTFLGGIFATLGAAATGAVPGADALASPYPGRLDAAQSRSAKTGTCTVARSGKDSTVHHTIQTTFNGKALSHTLDLTMTHPDKKGQAVHITSTRTITLGGDSLLTVEKDSQGSSTQVKLTYGAAFQGVKEVVYTTDGKQIQGTIDGQKIAPISAGADSSSLRLATGKTPPAIKPDAALESALSDLLKKAEADVSSCAPRASDRGSNSVHDIPSYASNFIRSSGTISAFTGFLSSWFAPIAVHAETSAADGLGYGYGQSGIPQNSSACQSCQDKCAEAALVCDAGACSASAACFFFWGLCCAGSLAICSGTAVICDNNCSSAGTNTQPGGACCPVGCPNVDGCCYQNQQCSGTANICCAENVIVCNGNCCNQGDTCCGNSCCASGNVCKDGVCCAARNVICKGVCCASGQVCSTEGICCKQLSFNSTPVSCSGTCCASGSKCAKGYPTAPETCCATEHICGTACCPAGCVNGNECAPLCLTGINCGKSCCDWGCADASTSTCKPAQKCASGQSVCPANQSGVPNLCCPNGTGCFNGKCCATGSIACIGKSTGAMGCFPQSQCATQPPPK